MKAHSKVNALLVMNRVTAELAEMTQSWMGLVIWLVEFNDIPKDAICVFPYVLYDDDKRFNDYDVIGEL